jgi:hypothetical protein
VPIFHMLLDMFHILCHTAGVHGHIPLEPLLRIYSIQLESISIIRTISGIELEKPEQ